MINMKPKAYIVDELHKIRLAHVEKFEYDLRAVFNDIKKHEKKNRDRVVALPIKRRLPMGKTSELGKVGQGRTKSIEYAEAL